MQYISAKQMARVDFFAVKKYNLPIPKMMENAGKNLAHFISRLKPKPKKILVFFGKGNNGGGGLAAARYLSKKGFKVEIIAASKDNNKNVKHQLSMLSKMKIKPRKSFKAKKGDLIIDALLGYNLKGAPRRKYKDLINAMNFMKKQGIKIVSLDLPSGIHPDKGVVYESYVKANYTLTLALPKKGLKKIKNVYLANIGIPKKVYSDLRIKAKNLFREKDIIKV